MELIPAIFLFLYLFWIAVVLLKENWQGQIAQAIRDSGWPKCRQLLGLGPQRNIAQIFSEDIDGNNPDTNKARCQKYILVLLVPFAWHSVFVAGHIRPRLHIFRFSSEICETKRLLQSFQRRREYMELRPDFANVSPSLASTLGCRNIFW
jgi:hypothetical protein